MRPGIPFALRPVACCVIAACCELAAANPTGPTVTAGSATFQNAAKALTITNTPGTIINWQGFSIAPTEITRFVQQSSSSAVLNRVVGPDPSSLLGTLSSNGRVFLINTNGIIVGAGARIDTAGFIASTLNISDTDFLQGRLRFDGGGNGPLRNAGTIRASGDIMLVGPQIENTGIVRSDNGAVVLAAGRKLTITSPDAQGVRFELQAASDTALNLGTLDARTAAMMFAGTLRHSGDIRVGTSVDATGHVALVAQKDAIVDSTATITANGARGGDVTVRAGELTWVEGSIEAKGSAGAGGSVQLLGDHVGLSGAKVDVSGETGGGTILVGGDYQGRNADIANAKAVFVGADSTLKADALGAGDGGKVIVWSDGVTRFDGAISARGGAASGEGGFVETSGRDGLAISSGRVDTRAPEGRTGTWLLDPQTINVVGIGASLPAGNLVPFGDLIGMPQDVAASAINGATSNVTLQANTDVNFNAAVSIAASGVGLTAQAGRSINVNQDITTSNGNVTLIANETTANGVIGPDRLAGAANITMAAGTTINAGNANVILGISPGFGHDQTSGNITVANITAGNVAVQLNGPTANGRILRADASSMLTGSTSVFLQTTTTGAGGSIGTSPAPIRVTTPGLEAQTAAASGGIFMEGTGDLGIGGVPLSIFPGTIRGVQALAGGPVSITTAGNLTHAPTALPSSMCGPGSNMGSNPICTVGVGATLTLSAASIGSPGGGRLQVQTSGSPVNATGTTGGVFLQQVNGTLSISNYSLSVPTGQAIELANFDSGIAVDTAMSFATSPITLFTASGDTTFGGVTVDASTLTLSGLGAARFNAAGATINAAITSDKPVVIAGGSATLNNGGTFNAGVNLSSGTLTVNGVNPATVNGGTLAWSGGTLAGSGSIALAGGATVDVSGGGARVLNGPALTIANMNLGGGLDVQAGTLSLPGTVTLAPTATLMLSSSGQIDAIGDALPRLVMSGGTLTRSVGGELAVAGDLTMTGGGIAAGGGGDFVTQGHTTIGGFVFPQRNWRNSGTLDIVPDGRMSPSPGGGFQFNNAPGGTVNLTTNLAAPFGAANEAVVVNQGTMNVSPPGPDAMSIPNAFTNVAGANLNVTTGSLDLADARAIAGAVSIAGGSTLSLSAGTQTVFDGTAISGTGTVQVRGTGGSTPQAAFRGVSAGGIALNVGPNGTATFDSAPSTFGSASVDRAVMPGDVSGTLNANAAVTISGALVVDGSATFNDTTAVLNSVMLSGTLDGTGAFSAPSLNWIGGTIQGAGVKTFTSVTSSDSQGSPHLAGNVALAAAGNWNHSGTLIQGGAGQLTIGDSAVVTNSNLSSWLVSSSAATPIAGSGTFENAGTFTNVAGPHTIAARFHNQSGGTVGIADGTALTLGPGGSTADSGLIALGNTATIGFNGDRTLDATSTISASNGTIAVSGGTLTASGTINTTGALSFTGGTAIFNADAPLTALTPSTMTVNGGTAVFFRPVTVGSTLLISAGRADFNEAATVGSTMTLSFGMLGGTGPVGVTGLTTWSGGGMDGSGTTTVNGGLAISGPSTKALALDRRVTIPVSATATWTGSGNIVVSDGSRITNLGQWLDQSAGATIFGGPTGGTFFNQGLYRRAASDGSASRIGIRFDNDTPAASVEVQNGTLRLSGGGTSSRPFSVTGTLEFASGASGYTVGVGSDITGSGSVVFSGGTTALDGGTYNVALTQVSGGTANFNSGVNVNHVGAVFVPSGTLNLSSGEAINAPSLSLTGGTLTGSDNVTVSGATTWTAGTMSGSGSTTTAGTLAISSQFAKNLNGRTLNNSGTATWDGVAGGNDRMHTGNGATINNSGTWNDRTGNNAHIINDLGGTMSMFNNTGDYVKSLRLGTAPSVIESMSIDIPYNVSGAGTTSVQAGLLRLTGGGASSRPFGIASGATLEFGGGAYDLNAGSNFAAAQGAVLVTAGAANFNGGTYQVAGGTQVSGGAANFNAGENVVQTGPITVSGGTLNLSSGEAIAVPALTLTGGTLTGSDNVTVSGATTWTAGTMGGSGATVANGGLSLGGIATKTLDGRTLTNGGAATWSAGRIATVNAAHIDNQGTWQDQTTNGVLDHTGAGTAAFNNAGTYTRTAASTTTIGTGVAFNNTGSGQVQVQGGSLVLRGGGAQSGAFDIASAGVLDLAGGNQQLNNGTAFSGAGVLRVSAGVVNVNITGDSLTFGSAGPRLAMTGGTLAGGTIDMNSGVDWSGGAISGATFRTGAGSNSNITGAVTFSDGVWINSGTVTMSGDSRLTLAGVSDFLNRGGATFIDGSTNATPLAGQFARSFDNFGTFRKTPGSLDAQNIEITLGNHGALAVDAGRLRLDSGGTHTGAFDIAGTLQFAGSPHLFDSSVSVTGNGVFEVSSNANVIFPSTVPIVSSTTWRVTGGSMSGALTLNGALDWSGGFVEGNGVLTTGATAVTSITGPATLRNKTWDNFGLVTLSGSGGLTMQVFGFPTTINNRPGGVFDVRSTNPEAIGSIPFGLQRPAFSNAGTLNFAPAAAGTATIAPSMTNSGTIDVATGTLTLAAFPSNAGVVNIASGATLKTNASALSNTGTIGGEGTLDLGGQTLTNLGHLRPGAAAGDTTGTLSVTGNLVQGATGVVDLELGGTNAGAFDTLAVSGTAQLGGTVNVTALPAYTPAIGDPFTVITSAGGRTGNFSTVNKNFATNMTAAYGATSLTFTIGGGPVNSWISTSGDWSVGGNWSLGHVPTSTETALLDQPGTLTITIPAGTFSPDAMTSRENIAIDGGTLSLAKASSVDAAFAMNNGSLQGAGLLTVNGTTMITGASQLGGRLTTTAFNMPSGSLSVANSAVLTFTDAGTKTLSNARLSNAGTLNVADSEVALSNGALLENTGTVNLSGAARIAMTGGGAVPTELANRAGGTFNDNSTNATPLSGTAGTVFTNAGTLEKAAAASAQQTIDAPFSNSGKVRVDAGTLALAQGGADSGEYAIASGAVLDLAAGARDLNPGTSFAGPGTLRLSGATVHVNTPLTQLSGAPALEITGGTLDHTADIALNTTFKWSGGTITGPGAFTTGPSTAATIDGTATLASSAWSNFGSVAFTGSGKLVLANDGVRRATFTNASGGSINDTSASATLIGFAGTRGLSSFDNIGQLVKAAGSAATQTIDVPMTNKPADSPHPQDGIFVASGTLVASSFPVNEAVVTIGAGATLSTAGASLVNAPSGVVNGNGTVDVGAATFTNAGTVAPGDTPGALTITGDYLQTATGRLEADLQGPVQGVSYDVLKVTRNAALDGELALNVGPAVAPGDAFQIVTYAASTGNFAKITPPGTPFTGTPAAGGYTVTRNTETTTAPPTVQNIASNEAAKLGDPNRRPTDPDTDRDPRDPRDPRNERRRIIPECR